MKNPYTNILNIKQPNCTPAQLALQGALLEMMQVTPHASISVKSLCQHAFVARSTFYTYYQNIDEILTDIEDQLIYDLTRMNKEVMEKGRNKTEDLQFFNCTLDYISEHKKPIYTLLIASPDYRFSEKWKRAIKYHFWERMFIARQRKNTELILEQIASVVLASYTFWLTHPYEVQTEDINNIVSAVFKTIDSDI